MSTRIQGQLDGHIPALDGIRGLAILFVMLHHFCAMAVTNNLDLVISTISFFGWVGVDLFFVLSGFLITGILLDEKGCPHYFRNFYVRRVLRIFPLYYLILLLMLVVLPQLGVVLGSPLVQQKLANYCQISGSKAQYWLYLSNFAVAASNGFHHGILDISWSLSIEEQFYLIWPLVVFSCSPGKLSKVCVGVIVGAILFRVIGKFYGGLTPVQLYVLTPARLDGLALGAWVALQARKENGLERLRNLARFAFPLGAFSILALAFSDAVWVQYEGPIAWVGAGMHTIGFTLLALTFASLLVLGITSRREHRLSRVLTSPLLTSLGKYCYALYLLHLPVRAVLRDVIYGPNGGPSKFHFLRIGHSELLGQILFDLIALLASYAVAYLSWNLFEKHFLKLKRFFEYGT